MQRAGVVVGSVAGTEGCSYQLCSNRAQYLEKETGSWRLTFSEGQCIGVEEVIVYIRTIAH